MNTNTQLQTNLISDYSKQTISLKLQVKSLACVSFTTK
ncbi:hypothetical protein LINPERPRIM_LOCUS8618 [Linum perenne]